MTKQTINVGTSANDGTGMPVRTAFQYLNANFTEIYNWLANGTGITTLPKFLPIEKGGTGGATASDARTALGLGTASTLTATTSTTDTTVGRALKVKDFGIGTMQSDITYAIPTDGSTLVAPSGFFNGFTDQAGTTHTGPFIASARTGGRSMIIGMAITGSGNLPALIPKIWTTNAGIINGVQPVRSGTFLVLADSTSSGGNVTVDSNGFIKSASPIIQLYADKIELNGEAELQDITFKKLGVGDYLISGSTGLAKEGWYIEQPRDANGNLFHVVEYKTLQNGDIEIKTFDYMLDKKGRIVADYDTPLDVQDGRWIDIRLNELPQAEVIENDTE